MTSRMIEQLGGADLAHATFETVGREELFNGFDKLSAAGVTKGRKAEITKSSNAIARLLHNQKVSSVAELASLTDQEILDLQGYDMGPSRIAVLNGAFERVLEARKNP